MKLRRGFTLIELIAVIMIMGIIAIITVPIVSNLLIDSRMKAAENSTNAILRAAEFYFNDNAIVLEKDETISFTCDDSICYLQSDNTKKLAVKGDIPISGEITLDENGKVYITKILEYTNGIYVGKNSDDEIIAVNGTIVDGVLVDKKGVAITKIHADIIGKTPLQLANSLLVTSGNGLYYDSNRELYYYRSDGVTDVNNYITYNDQLWRIVNINSNGNIKIIKSTPAATSKYDMTSYRNNDTSGCRCVSNGGCNIWTNSAGVFNNGTYYTCLHELPSYLYKYANETYYNTLSEEAKELLVKGIWYYGPYIPSSNSFDSIFNYSDSLAYVAGINVYEYIMASTNSECTASGQAACNNYLSSFGKNVFSGFWTITPQYNSPFAAYKVKDDGILTTSIVTYTEMFRPVVYVTANIILTGEGKSDSPYIINKK